MIGLIVMLETIVNLKISELKPGMILAEKLRANNKILALENDRITNNILKQLRFDRTVNKVKVYNFNTKENDNFPIYYEEKRTPKKINPEDKIKAIARANIEKLEKNLNSISQNLYKTFAKFDNLQNSTIKEIKILSQKLQDEIKDFDLVVQNLAIYGSGEDTIYRHSINVAIISNLIGQWLEFSEEKLISLTYSALLHDIGKTKIDINILNKPYSLTAKDYLKVKEHPILGYNIVKEISEFDASVSQGILMHHERIDGSGYPLGIKGDKISQFAKIIAIADVFDAINSERSYRHKMEPFEAIETIKKESLCLLDYNYSNVFISHIIIYYIGKDVLLSNKKIGKIIKINPDNLDKPLIQVDDEFIDLNNSNLYIKKFVL